MNLSIGRKKQQKMVKEIKRVQFSDSSNVVYTMYTWSYAYREARRGRWQQDILDRMRFKRRLTDIELIVSRVLDKEHRYRVYRDRFENIE